MPSADWVLVWSNAFYLLAVAVLVYKSKLGHTQFGSEIALFLCVTLASSAHHVCDSESISHCLQPKYSLYSLDVLFSYLAIGVSAAPFLKDSIRELYLLVVIPCVLGVVLAFLDSYEGALIVVLLAASAFALAEGPKIWSQPKRHWVVLPAVVVTIVGVVCKSQSDKYDPNGETSEQYRGWHSTWHALTAVGAALLVS